uniref:Uncharacterized protein n=1 Tax=Anopheles dirus TaxID=7168 RepID=A0A182NIU4_9DIPT
MRSLIALIVLVACIALVHSNCLPNKYPYTRDRCYVNNYQEYPPQRQNHLNYYQHNYVVPDRHDGYPYFGYPYGECSSCRSYQTEEVQVVKPDCPCQHGPVHVPLY